MRNNFETESEFGNSRKNTLERNREEVKRWK